MPSISEIKKNKHKFKQINIAATSNGIIEKFANEAITQITQAVTNASTTSIKVGPSSDFPSQPQFRIKIDDELLLVTALSGNIWTVVRGIEGSIPAKHSVGSQVCLVLTANSLARVSRGNLSFGVDQGGLNNVKIFLDPQLEDYFPGMYLHFQPKFTNTGSVKINVDNLGAVLVKKNVTANLQAGDIVADQIASVIYDGTFFQLLSVANAGSSTTTDLGSEDIEVSVVTDTFTLSESYVAATTKVYLNGQKLRINVDYTEQNTDQIVICENLKVGDWLSVDYQKL